MKAITKPLLSLLERQFTQLLAQYDISTKQSNEGIVINDRDIIINDNSFLLHILFAGDLAFGDAWENQLWDSNNLDTFIIKYYKSNLFQRLGFNPLWTLRNIQSKLVNFQTRKRAYEVGKNHYDIGNDLYEIMLDSRMIYSCAYFSGTENLNEAQENKLDLLCKKALLPEKNRVSILDLGCGFGGLLKYACEYYDVDRALGVTISKNQHVYATVKCEGEPINIALCDYRELLKIPGNIDDAVFSVGQFEHIGYKNYPEFFHVVNHRLKENGIFVLHTICSNVSNTYGNIWVNERIFPNSHTPSLQQILNSVEGMFDILDIQNLRIHYYHTLMAWWKNCQQEKDYIIERYGLKFYRRWELYCKVFAYSFLYNNQQVYQIVMKKHSVEKRPDSYIAAR